MTSTAPDLDTAAAVLDAVRTDRAVADAAEARLLQAAVQWAAMHSTDSIEDAACDWYGDQPIPVAGEGAPLVAEFSITEFAIAIGLPTETGKAYLGEALELRHRLPRVWDRVVARPVTPHPADRRGHRRVLCRQPADSLNVTSASQSPRRRRRRVTIQPLHGPGRGDLRSPVARRDVVGPVRIARRATMK